jgi:excinuclease ABC subunit A
VETIAAPVTPARPRAVRTGEIRIVSARAHNLAGVSCRIPLERLTVVTGVSGSGKSSLAFDTLYAEGQRRYVASLSTYARQFLERLPRPEVDHISHLPPAVAIEQRNRVTQARSTVGSATEVLDHLRLLFAKIGETRCPDCGERVEAGTVQSVADGLRERFAGARVSIGAPIPASARGRTAGRAMRERLAREGFTRLVTASDRVVDFSELGARELAELWPDALLLVDRMAVREGDPPARLAEAVATAFARGEGRLVAIGEGGLRVRYREGFACHRCDRAFPFPEPALFSWNSALGACPACQGFGRVAGLDLDRVVPDPGKTLAQGAIAPFQTPLGKSMQRDLVRAAKRLGIPLDVPFASLPEPARALVVEGDGDEWYGVRGWFEWLESKRYKVQHRVAIARHRRFDPCAACGATRLRPEALCVRVAGRDIAELSASTLRELLDWTRALPLAGDAEARAGRIRDALALRLATAVEVGLGYLSLARQTRTLSGGEAQRIQLATALGGALTASLYVLDEPSIGLHPRDVARLLEVLRRIRDHGNTVVVVEHAPEVVRAADHVIDLGPGPGRAGGRLVAEGSVEELRLRGDSVTARALRGELQPVRRTGRPSSGALRVRGARANNLAGIDVEFPLGQLVVVTGVSGAGKSTLVRSVLVGQLTRDPERGACDAVLGAEAIERVIWVDPSPPARSPRSNPATVTKAFDAIRRRFASTRDAKQAGAGPGWFSFNVPGGRCETCEGAGEVVVDMQFLDDVRVPCDVCGGQRYRPEALEIRIPVSYRGRREDLHVVEVLALTIDDALEAFADDAGLVQRLSPLSEVGLGYLSLGQPLSTLSGGEAQRLRLAQALAEPARSALFVLDEPTTGLHPADVQVLVRCLDRLLERGASVIVIEHNLEVVACADWVIDLGPEGGPDGGRLVVAGPPAAVAACEASATGAALRAESARARGPASRSAAASLQGNP